MKLISAKVHGYKRFQEKSTINLDGKLIAIIGPNEAGKSSLLAALQHLSNGDPFKKDGVSQELTRGVTIPDDQMIVEATFLLDESDKNAVLPVADAKSIRWLVVKKAASGKYYANVLPTPTRDFSRRRSVVETLQHNRELIKIELEKNSDNDESVKQVDQLIATLSLDDEQLPKSVIEEVESVAKLLSNSEIATPVEALRNVATELNNLVSVEESKPSDSAMQILFKRRPQFLFFNEEARNLQSHYDLEQLGQKVPLAVMNLLRVANLNLNNLRRAVNADDQGLVETMMETANDRLRAAFSNAWSQANVTVRLRVSGKVLHVLVGSSGGSYVAIAERSDGLRQYVSLLTFASLENVEQTPILLIDEAELHLHYDAQADLVQMLARQQLATKVIYTTHSVGCLPEDLGTGVRLVEADSQYTSIIRNWFWETDQPGFSPLIFGIGAKTLAFMPVRFALVTEGPTDIILLPTLFREATGKSSLGFQVVPGLSVADETGIGVLENGAPRTAYLVDSDKGGGDLRRQLQQSGIPDERILTLPDEKGRGCVLEDFVDRDVYLAAVNEELNRSHGETLSMSTTDLPEIGRPKAVEYWCKTNGIKPPSKRAIAYRILEQAAEQEVLANIYKSSMLKLCQSIEAVLTTKKL